jgi:putative spermidine/putrescine transport system substrate-binding protein
VGYEAYFSARRRFGMNHTISRRALLGSGLALFALPLVSCGNQPSTGGSGPVTINVYSSGDVNVKNLWTGTFIPEFEKSHKDIKVKLTFEEHGTNDQATFARLSAAVQQGKDPGIDIIDSGIVNQAQQANLLVKLSTKEVAQLSKVDDSLVQAVGSMAVPYRASSVVLAYNSQYVTTPPKTLQGVLDWVKANSGKFTYNDPAGGGSGSAFVQAILRAHISSDQQKNFTTGADYKPELEEQWKPGFAELKSLKPYIYQKGLYAKNNQETLTLLGNSSIWLGPVWSDQALTALGNKTLPDTIKLVQLDPPFNGGPAYMGVPKTSTHIKEAQTFLDWVLNADIQAKIISAMNGYPGVKWEYVPDDVRQKYADIAKAYATGFASKFSADMNKQWQTEVAGG